MDPNATYKLMCDCISRDEWEEAREYAINLRTWLCKGGSYPTTANKKIVDTLIKATVAGTKSLAK